MNDKPGRGRGTVTLPEMRRARIGLCVATQLARLEHDAYSPVFGWRSAPQAWAMTQGQLAWYRAMEELGEMVQEVVAEEMAEPEEMVHETPIVAPGGRCTACAIV